MVLIPKIQTANIGNHDYECKHHKCSHNYSPFFLSRTRYNPQPNAKATEIIPPA